MSAPTVTAGPSRQQYVERLLALYRATPGTTGVARPADRRLAADLFHRHVPLHLVHLALRLAVARRQLRPHRTSPLPPIRSLHYVLPLLDELSDPTIEPAYLDYLRHRLAPSSDQSPPITDHRLS